MPKVEESILINAPVAKVFDFIANNPQSMPDWWPPMTLQERVTPPPTQLGSVSRYAYNMMGLEIRGEHEVTAFTPDEHLQVTTTSGLDSMFDFHFADDGGNCRLTVRVDYEVPGGILGRIANQLVVERKNLEDLQTGLQNLKRMMGG